MGATALALGRGQSGCQPKPTRNPLPLLGAGALRWSGSSGVLLLSNGGNFCATPNFLQRLPGHPAFWHMGSGFSSGFWVPHSSPCAPLHSLLPVSRAWWSQSGQPARRRHNVVFMCWPERMRSSLLRGAPTAVGPSAARFCFPNESCVCEGRGWRPEIVTLL